MRKTIAICALLLTLGCGPTNSTADGPTQQELVQALEISNPERVILDAALTECEAAQIQGQPAQVCGVCVADLSRLPNPIGPGFLVVSRRTGSVAFRRAFSADQPDVEPAQGDRGVWIAATSNIHFSEDTAEIRLSEAQMNRVGYRRCETESVAGCVEPGRLTNEVAQRLAGGTLRSELAALVGGCTSSSSSPGAPPPSPVEMSNTTASSQVAHEERLAIAYEQPLAEFTFHELSNRQFRVDVRSFSDQTLEANVQGDDWFAIVRLDDTSTKLRTLVTVARDHGDRQRLEFGERFVWGRLGSLNGVLENRGAFLPMVDGATYSLRMSQFGVIMRPVNEAATSASRGYVPPVEAPRPPVSVTEDGRTIEEPLAVEEPRAMPSQ